MLLPKFIFPKLTDISTDFLQKQGIDLLLMDFDNTMLPYTTNEPTQELLSWMSQMKRSGITLCVVSNSKKQRVPRFCQKYDITCVTHAGKPGTRGIREALARFPEKKGAFVGDQIFTDVLGANRAKLPSIIVKSIHNHTIWLKLRHVLEVPFLAMARKRRVQL